MVFYTLAGGKTSCSRAGLFLVSLLGLEFLNFVLCEIYSVDQTYIDNSNRNPTKPNPNPTDPTLTLLTVRL